MKRLLLPAGVIAASLMTVPAQSAGPPGSKLTIAVRPSVVTLGSRVKIDGHLTLSNIAQPGHVVRLFAQRFPYRHSYRAIASTTTSGTGGYVFRTGFPRNTHVKTLADNGTKSATKLAVTLPRLHLSSKESKNGRRLRVTLSARSPGYVRLGGRVVVYLGDSKATSLRAVGHPRMRVLRPGLSRMSALFGLPRSWRGGFRVGTCYSAPRSTGMYQPGFRCPHRFQFVATGAAVTRAYSP
jgi:hypothetical protein